MFVTESFTLLLGIGLCILAVFPVALWFGQSFGQFAISRNEYSASTREMRAEIRDRTSQVAPAQAAGAWNGYRSFIVDRVVRETFHTTSLYLKAADAKPIVGFNPGQHVTVRMQIKGKTKPQVRCYSLSDGPGKEYYRISVRHVSDRGNNKGPGVVSNEINVSTKVGDRINLKAPSGHFYLNENSDETVVLLGGGIGITPMISMLEHLVQTRSPRTIVLFHGVRNGTEQAFKDYLQEIKSLYLNVHVVSCYSSPNSEDVAGVDYQIEGFVSVDVLKAILPGPECQFYLCGPPPFMQSLFSGLQEWGVTEDRINYENFGPSTIRTGKVPETTINVDEQLDPITFLESDEIVLWNPQLASLLELAEAHDVPIESGCRSGSCGTCETALISGKVKYLPGEKVNCNPGCCLPCIARPDGPVELEA